MARLRLELDSDTYSKLVERAVEESPLVIRDALIENGGELLMP